MASLGEVEVGRGVVRYGKAGIYITNELGRTLFQIYPVG
jgi:hypothetical protein